ncbi:MAG: S8 family serine peptidase [Gemmatimonadetes bacterium]|nr:S8 family serine peptidase [Gemmatimonadota bacterium]
MWPSLRNFLRVPGELTGKNVRIAVIDGEFPNHPDISTNERRTSYLVRGMSEPETPLEIFQAEPGPWSGGWHALCAAAAAGGSGAESQGIYKGVAPEADLFLVALYSREPGYDIEKARIKALEWVLHNWRKYEIRGVLSASKSRIGSGLFPWQTDPRRILCEELASEGVLVVSGSGNRSDETTGIAEAAAPSVLSVGGVAIPQDGDPHRARMYQGCRGTTFEGKWIPDILAPAENVVLPHRNDEEIENHFYAKIDDIPFRYARTNGTSFSGPALLGAAACLWQAHPGWTAREMKSALISSSLKRPEWSDLSAGLVSVSGAMANGAPETAHGHVTSLYQNWSFWRKSSLEHRLDGLKGNNPDEVKDVILSFVGDDLSHQAISLICKQTKHPVDSVRAAALCALAGGSPSQVDSGYILSAFRDSSPVVRMAGVYLLRGLSDLWSEFRVSFRDLFDDTSLDVRIEALYLAPKMAYPDFAEGIVAGLEEDARMGRVANFAARLDALEAITGQRLPLKPPFVSGQPHHADALRVARVDQTRRWEDWLSENWLAGRM